MDSNCPPITVTKEERGRSGTTTVVSQDDDADPIPVGSKRTLQRPIPLPRFTPRTVLFICLYLFFFFSPTARCSQPQEGYTPSIILSLIFYPLATLPLCLGFLAAYWLQPQWIWLTCWKCPLNRAVFVVAKVCSTH